MCKYISDTLKNNSRSVFSGLTRPQYKAMSEVLRGLYTENTPVLRLLAQDAGKVSKKQGEKYSYHLGNVELTSKVQEAAITKVKHFMRKNTIIAYDLTDISKEAAKKIEKLSTVFDGSKRKPTTGFSLHGIGINNMLITLQIHDSNDDYLNDIRAKLIKEVSEKLSRKGIWVFDRGNDDKQFFNFLRHNLKVQFIARLRSNRDFVEKETGAILKVGKAAVGRYEVYLKDQHNCHVDTRATYTLIVSHHLDEDQQPIRLLCSLASKSHTDEAMVTMYLERWGIENTFKRAKQKFKLEKIRVLSFIKFKNLVALIQLAVNLSAIVFVHIHKSSHALITKVLLLYKRFLRLKSLYSNLDSFISFMQQSLPKLLHKTSKPTQLTLLSRRQLVKLGSF